MLQWCTAASGARTKISRDAGESDGIIYDMIYGGSLVCHDDGELTLDLHAMSSLLLGIRTQNPKNVSFPYQADDGNGDNRRVAVCNFHGERLVSSSYDIYLLTCRGMKMLLPRNVLRGPSSGNERKIRLKTAAFHSNTGGRTMIDSAPHSSTSKHPQEGKKKRRLRQTPFRPTRIKRPGAGR